VDFATFAVKKSEIADRKPVEGFKNESRQLLAGGRFARS
jgi:hypothetical protein